MGQKASEMPILTKVQLCGVTVDISTTTINRMVYGPEFAPLVKTMEFDYRMRERHNQHPWLVLCKEAHVPILAGMDVETTTKKKHDLEKSKYEIRHGLRLHKSVSEVFGPNGKAVRVARDNIDATMQKVANPTHDFGSSGHLTLNIVTIQNAMN
ncbi:hypothetical protein HAX54_027847 [Datura stramonium]|uniref:Uncharacterized protein n=1 Tax=Datura stramonium TaxID=4076 RepID=A0ABS8RKN1_DATST|nr:hypothetical protein [Datura stramonium]